MATSFEILFLVGLVAFGGAWALKNLGKYKKPMMAIGAASVLGVLAFGGAFGFGPYLAAGPGVAPTPQGVWNVVILDTSDTDRAEASELLSADLHTITYSISDADIDDVGDVDLNIRIVNANTGLTTQQYVGEISIASMPTVLVGGVATPIANYTADLSRFAVTYTEDAGAGDTIQLGAKATFSTTSGALEDVSIDLDTSDAVMDDMAGGQQVTIVYLVGGVSLSVVLQDNGSVT